MCDSININKETADLILNGFMVVVAILIILYQLRILRLYYETYKNLRDSLVLIPKSSYLDIFISLIIDTAELIRLALFMQDVLVKIDYDTVL